VTAIKSIETSRGAGICTYGNETVVSGSGRTCNGACITTRYEVERKRSFIRRGHAATVANRRVFAFEYVDVHGYFLKTNFDARTTKRLRRRLIRQATEPYKHEPTRLFDVNETYEIYTHGQTRQTQEYDRDDDQFKMKMHV